MDYSDLSQQSYDPSVWREVKLEPLPLPRRHVSWWPIGWKLGWPERYALVLGTFGFYGWTYVAGELFVWQPHFNPDNINDFHWLCSMFWIWAVLRSFKFMLFG